MVGKLGAPTSKWGIASRRGAWAGTRGGPCARAWPGYTRDVDVRVPQWRDLRPGGQLPRCWANSSHEERPSGHACLEHFKACVVPLGQLPRSACPKSGWWRGRCGPTEVQLRVYCDGFPRHSDPAARGTAGEPGHGLAGSAEVADCRFLSSCKAGRCWDILPPNRRDGVSNTSAASPGRKRSGSTRRAPPRAWAGKDR
jgi:hypothetical protein